MAREREDGQIYLVGGLVVFPGVPLFRPPPSRFLPTPPPSRLLILCVLRRVLPSLREDWEASRSAACPCPTLRCQDWAQCGADAPQT